MRNPLLTTILRCSLGFVLLGFGTITHSKLFIILAMINFLLAGAWLWIQKEETQ